MTFDQIQYFIAIAECNTYFDAAEELNISQSALSKQIIKLEKELGVTLLDRSRPEGFPYPRRRDLLPGCPGSSPAIRDHDRTYEKVQDSHGK